MGDASYEHLTFMYEPFVGWDMGDASCTHVSL